MSKGDDAAQVLLAERLAPPVEPALKLSWALTIGTCCAGYIVAIALSLNGWFAGPVLALATAVASAYTSRRDLRNNASRSKLFAEQTESWQAAMRIWNRLSYCSGCHMVLDPVVLKSVPVVSMPTLLHPAGEAKAPPAADMPGSVDHRIAPRGTPTLLAASGLVAALLLVPLTIFSRDAEHNRAEASQSIDQDVAVIGRAATARADRCLASVPSLQADDAVDVASRLRSDVASLRSERDAIQPGAETDTNVDDESAAQQRRDSAKEEASTIDSEIADVRRDIAALHASRKLAFGVGGGQFYMRAKAGEPTTLQQTAASKVSAQAPAKTGAKGASNFMPTYSTDGGAVQPSSDYSPPSDSSSTDTGAGSSQSQDSTGSDDSSTTAGSQSNSSTDSTPDATSSGQP